MPAKVVEAIIKILDGLKNNYTLEEVSASLKNDKVFDEQTVGVAFSLIYDKVLSSKIAAAKAKKDKEFRMFSEEEKNYIGIDNSNYLIYLLNIGLIDNDQIEIILEQLLMFPRDTISKNDINWIILISLVDFNNGILPGSRILLYSSDTIN